MIRKSNDQTLGEIIRELLERYRLDERIVSVDVTHSWEKVVGELINRHTTSLYVRRKTLYVRMDSAALKNELGYAKSSIVAAINKQVGKEAITEVVFL
ncbi:MAG: DUF721 domain-containing protein [Bacteroidales bacterium]